MGISSLSKNRGTRLLRSRADHKRRWSAPRRRRFFIRIRASGLAYQHSRKTGLLRSLADHEKRWSAPRRRRFFIRIRASGLAYQHSRKTGLLRSLADHEKRWSAPRRRRFFIRIRASGLADQHSRKTGDTLLRSLADHKKRWSAPRRRRFFIRIRASGLAYQHSRKTGRRLLAAGQTTKNDGLPHGGGGFSFVSVPAGWHINTLEKPGDTSASQPGQTTKNDGLPHGGGGFSFVSVPAGWHINTLEKPGRYVCFAAGADHKKRWSALRRRRIFIRIRASGLAYQHSRKTGYTAASQPGRPQKTMVCPTGRGIAPSEQGKSKLSPSPRALPAGFPRRPASPDWRRNVSARG